VLNINEHVLAIGISQRTEPDAIDQLAKNIFRRDKVICRVSDPHLQILYHKAYELETICPTVLTEQAVFRALSK